MRDTQNSDTSLKQPFSVWPQTQTDLLKKAETDDPEPFRKAPAPSTFHTPEILLRFAPDPLLAITPEKSLGHTRTAKKVVPLECGDVNRKGRQRVRFAPDTRSSPPSKDSGIDIENKSDTRMGKSSGDGVCDSDEESMPRSFPPFSQKLYQPGRYKDHDERKDTKLTSSTSKSSPTASAPKRYTVETQGNKTVFAPLDRSTKSVTSEYTDFCIDKPVTARIIRHKPANICTVQNDESTCTELKEIFENSRSSVKPLQTSPRSCSTSPSYGHSSPHQSHKASPGRYHSSPASSPTRHCLSPSRSPVRFTPTAELEVLTPDIFDKSDPLIQVIREAPYQPRLSDYVFPFEDVEDGKWSYDSSRENPLARPEFNSALKISEELKSVKGKRPDTWGAVSHKLKTCDRKRTQIQEKASSRVNIQMQSGLYSDLVDVDVPLDDLCQNVEKGISLRAPSPRTSVIKVPVGKEPDLMEFFSPGLQQELPDLTLTGIQPITENLTTANPTLAFDLYRHNRAWNGLADS